jgi:hypothetical protein
MKRIEEGATVLGDVLFDDEHFGCARRTLHHVVLSASCRQSWHRGLTLLSCVAGYSLCGRGHVGSNPAVVRKVRIGARRLRGSLARRAKPVDWLELRRTEPIDRRFGLSRGTPVDRFYIERFLGQHRDRVRGDVLEVGDARYTEMFGGSKVRRSSVLHAVKGNKEAAIVGDLSQGLPEFEESYDCLIVTQVLPFIYDVPAAVRTIRSLCRPGGVALVTVPGISQVSRYDMDRWGDYWRFTELSARQLFSDAFGSECVQVSAFGNVLGAVCLLHGIAAEELTDDELLALDADYPLIVGVVAEAAA